jgi:hypothetical protein
MSKQAISYKQLCEKFQDWAVRTGQFQLALGAEISRINGYTGDRIDLFDFADTPLAKEWAEEFIVIDPKTGEHVAPAKFLARSDKLLDNQFDTLERIIENKIKSGSGPVLSDILSSARFVSELNPEDALNKHPDLDTSQTGNASSYINGFRDKQSYLVQRMLNHSLSVATIEQLQDAKQLIMDVREDSGFELAKIDNALRAKLGGGPEEEAGLSAVWRRHVAPVVDMAFRFLIGGEQGPPQKAYRGFDPS